MNLVVRTRSVEETEAVGERLGRALQGGEFIALKGPLGAGKTAFVRGLARGLDVPRQAQVSSPTFAIVHAYSGGRVPLFHADLYRVTDAEELYDAGFYDLVAEGAVVCVEWIDRVPEIAPKEHLEIEFIRSGDGRDLVLTVGGSAAARLVRSLEPLAHPPGEP